MKGMTMHIPGSVLSHHHKHVYWISGGACGGKSTMARLISEKQFEQFLMTVLDLMKLSTDRLIVCEGSLPPRMVERVAAPSKVVFLFPEQELLCRHFFVREDQRTMLELINTLSEPDKKKQNVLDCALSAEEEIAQVKALGLKTVTRPAYHQRMHA